MQNYQAADDEVKFLNFFFFFFWKLLNFFSENKINNL